MLQQQGERGTRSPQRASAFFLRGVLFISKGVLKTRQSHVDTLPLPSAPRLHTYTYVTRTRSRALFQYRGPLTVSLCILLSLRTSRRGNICFPDAALAAFGCLATGSAADEPIGTVIGIDLGESKFGKMRLERPAQVSRRGDSPALIFFGSLRSQFCLPLAL